MPVASMRPAPVGREQEARSRIRHGKHLDHWLRALPWRAMNGGGRRPARARRHWSARAAPAGRGEAPECIGRARRLLLSYHE